MDILASGASDLEEGEDPFAPRTNGSTLGALFSPNRKSQGQDLKYRAPKEPGTGSQGAKIKDSSGPPPRVESVVVDAFHLDTNSNQFVPMGKVRITITEILNTTLLVLYRSQKERLCTAQIQEKFQLLVQDNFYCNFVDSKQTLWSILFHSTADLEHLAVSVTIEKFRRGPQGLLVQDLELSKPFRDRTIRTFDVTCHQVENGMLGEAIERHDNLRGDHFSWFQAIGKKFIICSIQDGSSMPFLKLDKDITGTIGLFVTIKEELPMQPKPDLGMDQFLGISSRMTKIGQSTLPGIRDRETQSSRPADQEDPRGGKAGTLTDIVLAENRLQNAEICMSLSRMDAKLERLLNQGHADFPEKSESFVEKQSEWKSNYATLKEEIQRLKQENYDLKSSLVESDLSHDLVKVKHVTKLLATLKKNIQSEFLEDRTYSGLSIQETMNDLLVSLMDSI